ncbi:MAG TPA: DUF1499 domain-containing protein [Methylocystis sp.]|nr:DUF1499 domain-containing protein [Methylocystis sp.]
MRRHLPPEPVSTAALWSQRLALFAATVSLLAVALARAKALAPTPTLATLGSAVALALAALLMVAAASVTIWRTGARGVGAAAAAFMLAALVLAYPAYLAVLALRLPELADISTDVDDPPDFSHSRAAQVARGSASHPRPEASQRAAQRQAYPDVEPIIVDLDADEALALVLKTAAARGWRLVDKRSPSARSGDAHADFLVKTRLLGFDEDVTVRIRPMAGQTRIDLRAASRYGRHDFGANAERITSFAEELQAQLDAR